MYGEGASSPACQPADPEWWFQQTAACAEPHCTGLLHHAAAAAGWLTAAAAGPAGHTPRFWHLGLPPAPIPAIMQCVRFWDILRLTSK